MFGGTSGPGDGLGGAAAGYSWDRFRYESPAGAPPASTYPEIAPQASPRSGVSTAPSGGVITPGAVVPDTPLICQNVNLRVPRRC